MLLVNVALIGVFATKNPINATKTLFNDAESTENPQKGAQKKRKEKKIKEIKRKGKEKEKEKNSPHFDEIYRNFDSKKTENNYQSVGEIFEEEKEKIPQKKKKKISTEARDILMRNLAAISGIFQIICSCY